MIKQSWMTDIDRLSGVINSLQKCLECTICLELMTVPMKTRCGHSFCKLCVGKIVNKNNASCPLCKKKLQKRSISKDDHLETCIQKFNNLVNAIQIDTHIDIQSYMKRPRDTRESCSDNESTNSNKRKQPTRRLSQSTSQVDNTSTSNQGAIKNECDNPAYDTNASSQISTTTQSNLTNIQSFSPISPDDAMNFKIRTWIHSLPDECAPAGDGLQVNQSKITPTVEISETCKLDMIDDIYRDKIESTGVIQLKKEDTSGLKYNAIHARVRAKSAKDKSKKSIDEKEPNVEVINDSDTPLSLIIQDQTQDQVDDQDQTHDQSNRTIQRLASSSSLVKQSSTDTNWSRVIEFGKEMRIKKSKVKKLNVSTEKNKNAIRIVDNVILSPNSKYNTNKNAKRRKSSNRETSTSPQESSSRKQETVDDKRLNLSSPNITKLEASLGNTSIKDKANASLSDTNNATQSLYITLKKKRMRIENLDNFQMKEIIGFGDDLTNVSHNSQHHEENENTLITTVNFVEGDCESLQSPEKLDQSLSKRRTIRDSSSTCDNNFMISLSSPTENRTPEHPVNDSVRKNSENIAVESLLSTPNTNKLSWKRNSRIDENKSPLLSDLPLSIRSSSYEQSEKDNVTSVCKSVDSTVSKNDSLFDRLIAVKRDLNPQLLNEAGQRKTIADAFPKRRSKGENKDENNDVSETVCKDKKLIVGSTSKQSTSAKSETDRNQGFSVKFLQLGTMLRRRDVKYFYPGKTKREQLMSAEVRVTPVYNMQQSISSSEIERHIRSKSYCNLATSPNLSNNFQENIRCMDNLAANPGTVSENAELSMILPTCNVTASSTPKKGIDSSRKKTECPSINTSSRSDKTFQDAGEKAQSLSKRPSSTNRNATKKASHAHSSTTNAIKLLSPDKDSQLKFLTIDSPSSQHAESSLVNSTRQQPELGKPATEKSKFSTVKEASNNTNANSNSDTKKKRRLNSSHDRDAKIICLDCEEQTTQGKKTFKRIMTMSSSDSDSESEPPAPKNWKRNTSGDQYDRDAQSTNKLKKRRLRRQDSDEDIRIRNIIDKWTNEHNTTQKILPNESRNIQDNRKSMKYSFEEKKGSNWPLSANAPEIEKRISSQKSVEPVISLSSNSIFNLIDVDNVIAQQPTMKSGTKTSQNSMDLFNDDIINKVLQIDRSQNNPNALTDSATRHDRINRGDKADKEQNLLQDNFDDIIANVELPQSEDTIPRTKQTNCNLNRTLTEQYTFNRPTMRNELGDVMSQMSTIPPSSTNDMFEHSTYSDKNVKKLTVNVPTNAVSENSNKENVVSYSKRKQDYVENRRNENTTMRNFLVNANDKDSPSKKIASDNVLHEKEKSFDPADLNKTLPTIEEINVSTRLTGEQLHVNDDEIPREIAADNESNLKDNSSEYDTLMNVTQQQINLQMFEEDLFGVAAIRNRTKTAKMTLPQIHMQDDDNELQGEQRTPTRRKQSAHNKSAELEEHSAEEDDIVETTPETKTKNSGSNVKTIDSNTKRNIATSYISPISTIGLALNKKAIPRSSSSTPTLRLCYEMHPLHQSTPKSNVASTCHLDMSVLSKNSERAPSAGIPSAKQTPNKTNKLCFVCSGLGVTQIANVKEFAQKYNANYVNQFDPSVTHVIVNTTEGNVAKSTLKYLQGIAHRKWIVSYKWIEDCVRQQKLVDEFPYEAVTCSDDINGAGPRNSRLRDKDLFEDFAFLCIGPYDDVSLSQYQDLLLATGATVVESFEALAAAKKGFRGILINNLDNIDNEDIIKHWYQTAKAAPIVADWIVECIKQYKLISLSPYVPYLSSQHLCAIGCPRELIEEDEEYSDAST